MSQEADGPLARAYAILRILKYRLEVLLRPQPDGTADDFCEESSLSVYISLYLSVFLLFLSPFLCVFSFLFFCPSLFFCFHSSCLASFFPLLKRTTSKYQIGKVAFINIYVFCRFPPCVVFQIPFSFLSFFFSLKVLFLFNIKVLMFQKEQVIKHQLLVKLGVATKSFFFYILFF